MRLLLPAPFLPALLLLACPAAAQPAQIEPAPVQPASAQPALAQPALAPPAPARPAWTIPAGTELLQAVRASGTEGLSPPDYGEAALAAALRSADPDAISKAAASSYVSLARAYLQGETPTSARLDWHLAAPLADPAMLKITMDQALRSGTVRQSLKAMLPTHPHYVALRASLADTTHPEMRATLRANMDRWRWMPRMLGETHILVNVPTFELALVQNGEIIATHRIITGAKKTPTPQFSTVATGVILNPPWVVPQSIIRESVGNLVRRSPSTARARGYTWASSGGALSVTQKPGPGNSLGQMKIDMPNSYAIFLHDTPAKALFDKKVRAFSHGCIRTHRALEFAGTLLAEVPGWDAARIAGVVQTRETTKVSLLRQIPVHVVYFTALPGPQGRVQIHPDVYGRDAPVIAALSKDATPRPIQPALAEAGCQADRPNRPA